jgi:hypothetical protein
VVCPIFARRSTVLPSLKATQRNQSHFGSYCHGPPSIASVAADAASIGGVSSGNANPPCLIDFITRRGSLVAALDRIVQEQPAHVVTNLQLEGTV